MDVDRFKPILKCLYTVALFAYILTVFLIPEVEWQTNPNLLISLGKIAKLVCLSVFLALYVLELIINQDFIYYVVLVPVAVFLIALAAKNVGDDSLLFSVIIIFLSKKVDFDSVVKLYFWIMLVSTLAITLFSKIGIVQDITVIFPYGVGHSMGFPHPNNLGIAVMVTILAWVYLNYKKSFLLIMVVSYIGAWFDFCVPLARTSAVILLVLPWLILVYRYSNKLKLHGIYFLSSLSILFVFTISLFLMFNLYDNSTSLYIRFTEAKSLYNVYGVHLLGEKIPFVSTVASVLFNIPSVILDCAYLRVLIFYGIIPTVLMIILFLILGRRIYIHNNQILMVIMVLFLIHGLMERNVLFAQWNFVLLGTFANLKERRLSNSAVNFTAHDEKMVTIK